MYVRRAASEFAQHYDLFPKSLGQILHKFSVYELHLSLTQGHWQHNVWGYAPHPSPPGVQMWAWFLPTVSDSDSNWRGLTSTLSGLFCASLNSIDETNTAIPTLSFHANGFNPSHTNRSCLRYVSLTREAVCTENLTPWSKLLPCTSKAGLATLLNALTLYNTNYHSLGIHVTLTCDQHTACSTSELKLELKHVLTVVFDPLRKRRAQRNWSMKSLFGRTVSSPCPLSHSSTIYVDIPAGDDVEFSPLYDRRRRGEHGELVEYDVNSRGDQDAGLNVVMKWKNEFSYPMSLQSSPLFARSYVLAYGKEFGYLHIEVTNMGEGDVVNASLLQLVPWYFRVYISSLRIELNGEPFVMTEQLNYVPGKDRARPHTLELLFDIPSESTVHFSVRFQKAFLRWTEHPPDANHGFYIPSAAISFVTKSSASFPRSPAAQCIYTEPQLVVMATPDFSMPYNVICFVCTIIAIAFGAIHNLTTKRFVAESRDKLTKLGELRQRLKKVFSRRTSKAQPSGQQ